MKLAASRMSGIETSDIRKLIEMAPPGSVNLCIGEPDFQPPKVALEAMKKAVDEGMNKYSPVVGIPQLREAIAEKYHKYHNALAKENVIVTVGAAEALFACAGAFYDPGDEVLVPDPGFVYYAPHAKLVGAKPVGYMLNEKNEFRPDINEIAKKITKKTKAIVLNSPSNPTGGILSKSDINEITKLAKEHEMVIISDEVYDEIIYPEGDFKYESFLSKMGEYDKVVYVSSFSKTYAMTGWRLGFAIGSKEVMDVIRRMHYYIVASPPTPTQYSALAMLKAPQDSVAHMVGEFRKRRDFTVKRVNEIKGMKCILPKGTFYAFPSYDFKTKINSWDLAVKLLGDKVIVTPGSSFGTAGEGHIRISYANSMENIAKGLDALDKGTQQYR